MKLLSYHICQPDTINYLDRSHDSNISYFDGKELHYLKTERFLQEKHNKSLLQDCNNIIKTTWNIDINSIDDIIFTSFNGNTVTNKIENKIFIPNIFSYSDYKYIDHHYAHALSISVLTDTDININIDGIGAFKSWSVYKDTSFIASGNANICGSIGLGLDSMAAYFSIKGHKKDLAGKLMGLQAYGSIDLAFLEKLREYTFYNMKPIFLLSTYLDFLCIDSKAATYEIKLNWLKTVHERCGELVLDIFDKYTNVNQKIGYSGGVAQNIIWNTKLKNKYKNLVIIPHSGDEGLSLGGLEYLRKLYNLPKFNIKNFPFIQSDQAPNTVCTQLDKVANALAEGKIVAWYQGHGEIGPRALGNRSILMDPRLKNGKSIINKIKNREFYRPFGASVLYEFSKEYFDLDFENPYMLYVGITQKTNLPAITHIDGTCRVQTVKEDSVFKTLLEKFYKLTGCPVLLNTSLNNSGKPIAGYINNAIEEFTNKNIDMLVIGNQIYEKGK